MDYPIRTLQQLRPLLVGFRKRRGLSQADVGALLGVTQQSYAKIEANPAITSVERLLTILRLLGSEIVLVDRVVDENGQAPSVAAPAAKAKKAKATPQKVTAPSKTTEPW